MAAFHEHFKGLLLYDVICRQLLHLNLLFISEISKHYTQKATLEHELPTATQKLITTNDCILSSVVALTNGAGKVMLLSHNMMES